MSLHYGCGRGLCYYCGKRKLKKKKRFTYRRKKP